MGKIKKIFRNKWLRKIISFFTLYILIKAIIENAHLNPILAIPLSLFLVIPEFMTNYPPKVVAMLYIHKKLLIKIVMSICILIGIFLFWTYGYDFFKTDTESLPKKIKLIIRYGVEGILIGHMGRKLVIHYFHQVIRARDVENTKLMIMILYVILLLLFPFGHKAYSAFYFLGVGTGFLFHFLMKSEEWQSAIDRKLKKHLEVNIEKLKEKGKVILSTEQEAAICYYTTQDWKSLKTAIKDKEEDNEIFFFLKVSMYRRLHQFDTVTGLLSDKIAALDAADRRVNVPGWHIENEHFFYLHWALNENEKGSSKENVIKYLRKALSVNSDCILSNATMALVLVNDVGVIANDNDQASISAKDEALKYITKAMRLYEQADHLPKVISLVIGMTIPFAQSYLLDTYAYVYFKNEHYKLSKALLLQCQSQDASYTGTYLHLAELYNEHVKNEIYIRSTQLNLWISILNEKVKGQDSHDNYIERKAKNILKTLE